jgi:8-oxo-dGTP pyrophosphatase MutT (NUDIX family)
MKFNIRVYGILLFNEQVLLSDENRFGHQFTKFPGGGLEYKEGIIDCLEREFEEELGIQVKNPKLFYINEDYVESAFLKEDQIVAVYYKVETDMLSQIELKDSRFDFKGEEQVFRLVPIKNLNQSDFRFPIDKIVVEKLKEK